jgi:hypothetical protein
MEIHPKRQKPAVGARIDWMHPLAQGLRACYLFNEDCGISAGTNGPLDLVTMRRSTLTFNTTQPSWVKGLYGPCLDLHGSGQALINLGNRADLFMAGAFWIRVICRPATTATVQYLLTDYDVAGSVSSFSLSINTGDQFVFNWENPNGTFPSATTTATFIINQWYDVCATWDGTTRRLYVNGKPDGTNATAQSRSDVGGNAQIGEAGGLALYFEGDIALVQIGARALSATEVLEAYTDPFGLFRPAMPRYRPRLFDEPIPLIAYRPISDISTGTWTTAPLFSKIDEVTTDDADFIVSAADPTNDTAEVELSDIPTPQAGTVSFTVRHRKV